MLIRLAITLLLIIFSTGEAQTISLPLLGGRGSVVTCQTWESNTTQDATSEVARYTTAEIVGAIITNAVDRSVCAVKLYIISTAGDPTLNDYYCSIWTVGASNALGTKLGTSDKVDGAAWSNEWVTFTFSTPVSTGANDFIVGFWMDNDADTTDDYDYSGTNYISYRFDNADGAWAASQGKYTWNGSTGAMNAEDVTDDICADIWTMQ